MKKTFHLHLVSDSTGGTLHNVARACISQFQDIEPIEHFWHMIRNNKRMESTCAGILDKKGIVFFTIVDEDLRRTLKRFCRRHDIPAIPVLEPVLKSLSSFLGQPSLSTPGLQHQLTDDYFDRIDAMDYAMQNDDGQLGQHIEDADVVIVGVSRTSKTPTCIYLSNRGVKAANIPFIPGVTDEGHLTNLKAPFVIALTTSPKRLVDIRSSRLTELKERNETDYINLDKVEEEVKYARRFYSKMKWPVIDVTRRSVEETSAEILKIMNKE